MFQLELKNKKSLKEGKNQKWEECGLIKRKVKGVQ